MNERIKEFAVKSGGFRDDGGKLISRFIENTDMTDEIQEFAELIVKECERALRPQLRDMISRGQAYELIKKHFGVE